MIGDKTWIEKVNEVIKGTFHERDLNFDICHLLRYQMDLNSSSTIVNTEPSFWKVSQNQYFFYRVNLKKVDNGQCQLWQFLIWNVVLSAKFDSFWSETSFCSTEFVRLGCFEVYEWYFDSFSWNVLCFNGKTNDKRYSNKIINFGASYWRLWRKTHGM